MLLIRVQDTDLKTGYLGANLVMNPYGGITRTKLITTGSRRPCWRRCPSDHPDRAARGALARGRPPRQSAYPHSCEILCDLKTDSLISPGDQGDGFVRHSHLLFAH